MKADLTLVPPVLREFKRFFGYAGFELRPVGGCVRDLVMGKMPKDWDCCTDALPVDVMRVLEERGFKPYDLSNGHGTVSVNVGEDVFEITTLRIDAETDGRHAKVEFVTDFKADAARRDFTFNAMSMALENGWVYDYFNGLQDLDNRVVRFVGDAGRRIQEDYLRILRFFRFAARFNFNMDEDQLEACASNAAGLDRVSGERIWMEMKQLLDYNDQRVFAAMWSTGVLDRVFNR